MTVKDDFKNETTGGLGDNPPAFNPSVVVADVSTAPPLDEDNIPTAQIVSANEEKQKPIKATIAPPVQATRPVQSTTTTPRPVQNHYHRPVGRLGHESRSMTCPHCDQEITSKTEKRCHYLSFISCGLLCALFPPCFFVPFLIPSCYSTRHTCPNCGKHIGTQDVCG